MKKNSEFYFLGNDVLNKLETLSKFVDSTNDKYDNIIYKNLVKTINLYSDVLSDNFYGTYSLIVFLENYINITNSLVSKYSKNKIENIILLNKFIELYAKENLEFKIYITKEFKQNIFFEEIINTEPILVNSFKKLSQVLSSVFKEKNTSSPAEIYERSKMNSIQKKAKKIVTDVIDLNKKANVICQKDLVKPTTAVMEVINSLPDLIVDNEGDFRILIDWLYKMFWDGSQEIRNYDKNNELKFINSLRRYFFHDLDHGKEVDIRKKFKDVKDIYISGCGKSIPECAKDWQNVQAYIYDRLIAFLENVKIDEFELVAS